MNDPKYTKALYDQLSSKLELGTQADFEKQIGTDAKFREAIYKQAGTDMELGDYKTFEGYVKKKGSPSDYGLPSKEVFAEMFGKVVGDIPKLETKNNNPSSEEVTSETPIQYPHWTDVSKSLGIPLGKDVEKISEDYGINPRKLGEPETVGGKKQSTTIDAGLRADGTKKANGFLGPLKRPDGAVSTELSIGVNMDGKETEIPTLIPTLTEKEKNYLLETPVDKMFTSNTSIFKGIKQKAIDHARGRIAQEKSPFADNNESPIPKEFLESKQPKEVTQPSDKTIVKTDIREPYVFTVEDYLKKRGVTPETIGLDPKVNTDRLIDVDEKVEFDKKLETKGLYSPDLKYRDSYTMAAVNGLYKGTANMIRDIGYVLNEVPQQAHKAITMAGAKIDTKLKGLDSETAQKYMDQVSSAIDNGFYGNLSGILKDGYEGAAKWLETAVKTHTPNNEWGRALESTGEFIPDLISIGMMPEAKAPLLLKYGMGGMLKFPAYLATKTYIEGAKEGKPLKDIVTTSAEGGAQGMIYNGLGVWAHEIGAISKSIGAGMWTSKATEVMANSLGFGALTKAEGGSVESGLVTGIAFSALGAPEAIKQAMQKKAMLNWMTATDNNIRMVAEQNIDPFKLRKESNDLYEKAQALPEGEQRDHLLWQKNIVDNTIDIAFMDNQILRNPKAFIDEINNNPALSTKEKKVWTNKVNETVNLVDPRIKEAVPITEQIKSLTNELEYWNDKTDADPDVKATKIQALENQIKEQKEARLDVFEKPLDKYKPKEDKKSETASEEVVNDIFNKQQVVESVLQGMPENQREMMRSELTSLPRDEFDKMVAKAGFNSFGSHWALGTIAKESIKPPVVKEKLSLGDKTFTDKAELFKHLDKVAIDKKSGTLKEGWMTEVESKALDEPTRKAISEWEKSKKKEEPPTNSYSSEPPEVTRARINDNLADLRDDYNSLSNAATKQKTALFQNMSRLAAKVGFLVKSVGKKVIVYNDKGTEVRRVATKGDYEKLENIEDAGFKNFVNTMLHSKEYMYGMTVPMGSVGTDKAVADLLSGKANKNSQHLIDGLRDAYNSEYVAWKPDSGPDYPITPKEFEAQVNNEKLKAFDEKYGELNETNVDKAAEMGLIDKTEIESLKIDLENESRKRIESEREWADEEARIAAETKPDELSSKVDNVPQENGDGKGAEEIKPIQDEKPNEPNPPVSKGEGDNVSGGTEANKEPVAPKGKAEPRTTDPVKQKQIDDIDKEYDEKIAAQEAIIPKAEADMRKALLEADTRNGLFGDTAPLSPDEIIKREEQGFTYNEETRAVVRKPFQEKMVEVRKEILRLEKERESKIGEVLKQQTLGFEETLKEPPKEGITFKDKIYQSVDEVQDAFDKGEITFDEQKPLLELVRRFENKKVGVEPLTDKPEELAWDEPLPLKAGEDPNFKNSDLNNAMSIRNLARNLIKNMGMVEGADIRTGFITRFARKARGLFNPVSGIIRVNNIRDLRALTHEMGHKLDFEIFDIRGIISASKSDPQLGFGVDFDGKTYSNVAQVEKAMKDGSITINDGNYLLDKVKTFEKKKLREKYSEIVAQSKLKGANLNKLRQKYGSDVVDGVLQRVILKKEFMQLLKDIDYPKSQQKREEGIAEFVYNYVIDPKQLISSTPNALAWFEKMIDNAPEIKNALHTLRQEFAEYDAQDIRTKMVAEIRPPVPEKRSWLDTIIRLGKDPMYNVVNMLRPIETMTKKWKVMMDNNVLAYKDPWISAKQLLGQGGRSEQWILYHPYFNRGNDVVIKEDVKGLMPILKPILGTADYLPYQTYLVALDAIESHNRGKPKQAYFDKETALAGKAAFEKQYGAAKLMEFQSDIKKYNESLLDFAAESGIISKETAQYWKQEHQYYVPLRRIAETYEIMGGQKKTITRDLLPEAEKAIFSRKGSQKQVRDIFESMIENTNHILASSERNLLNRNLGDMFRDIHNYNKSHKTGGAVIEEINAKGMEAYQDPTTGEIRYAIAKIRPKNFRPPKGRILVVKEEGVPRFYDVAPEYYDDIFRVTNTVAKNVSGIMKVLSAPSHWLQAGAVVYDPTFPVRNIVRDQTSTWFTSKHGYLPTDFLKGIFSAIKKDNLYQKWLASGGDQSFLISADQAMSQNYFDKKLGKFAKRKFDAYKRNPLLALQDFSKASEIGTRLGAFRNAYKKTGNVKLAAIESRDITADYGIHGAMTKQLFSLYPFLNARTQWARTIVESMRNPASFMLKGMALTIPAAINWLINNQDEESQKLYQSLPTWRRVGLFNVRIPGTDHFLPLPKGFYGVLFASSIESLLDAATKDDPRVLKELPQQLFQEISPISNWPEVIPFLARPQIEMWANKKGYTGKPIVSESMKLLKPSEQYYNSTPEIIKKMGEALNWSPVKIEHYFKSYTGGAGIGAVNILDETLQAIGLVDKKPEDTFTMLSRMPVFKALMTERPIGLSSGYISDFYETLDKIEKVNVTFNNFVKTDNMDGLEKFMSYPENKRMYSFYEGNSTALNSFRSSLTFARDSMYAVMRDDTLTREQKQVEVQRINEVIQESALKFKDAYENQKFFDYSKSMDEIITKMKDERKDYRNELVQQQQSYNPYWMQLREQNKDIFDRLKEFGGLRNIEQTRSLTIEDKKVDLELEDVRLFNETVVKKYGENVKNMIGTTKADFEENQKIPTPTATNPDQNQLQDLLKMAWDEAMEETRNNFEPQQSKINK